VSVPRDPSAGGSAPGAKSAGRRSLNSVLAELWSVVAIPLIAIVLALIVGALVMIATSALRPKGGFDPGLPLVAYASLLGGAFGSPDAIVGTFVFAAPLCLAGLGVAVGFKAGLFNIGAQGQFLIGALGAVAVGGALHASPAIVAIPLALVAGVLTGALWGGIVGVLKATSGAHEVVTTIMMNYIAFDVLSWLVSGPLRLARSPQPITADVGNAALPILIGRNGHLGILLALLAVPAIWFLLYRTTRGFEIRTVGANLDAARYAGMRPRWLTVLTMGLAGGLAGLAGAGSLLGINHQMSASFSTTVGFDSITVALLGRSNPFGVLFSALFFGAMRQGAGDMQVQAGLPTELVDVIEAVLLFFLVVGPIIGARLRLRNVKSSLGDIDAVPAALGGEAAN
jgi:general nucleoside transport system permease protein